MSDTNRRSFLIAAGAGVAGAAVVAHATRADAVESAAGAESPHSEILAHVRDVRAGTISLMVNGHQVNVTDPALAARIAAAMQRGAA